MIEHFALELCGMWEQLTTNIQWMYGGDETAELPAETKKSVAKTGLRRVIEQSERLNLGHSVTGQAKNLYQRLLETDERFTAELLARDLQAISHEVSSQPANSFRCHTSARCASLLSSSFATLYSAPCSKYLQINSLRALELSCLSFCNSFPLFSIVCGLFCKNRGVGVPCAFSRHSLTPGAVHEAELHFRSLVFSRTYTNPSCRTIDRHASHFQTLTNPFSRNPFLFTSIQNAGVWHPRTHLRDARGGVLWAPS
jgi:hypothetical protein